MERTSQFKTLFAGAVIGAAGVLLLAPQSGRKTRAWLGGQTQWAGQRFGQLAETLAQQAGKKADPVLVDGWSAGRMAWVMGGVLAAASAALLLAPQSGKETRRWLADQARTGRDRLKEAGAHIQDFAQTKTQGVRDTAKEGADVVESTAQRIADTAAEVSLHTN
jgi:gas vesicle protein